jgi:hypothetical protein
MRTTILLFSFMLPLIVLSQKTITGKVFDATNNRPLLSASVVANGKEGVVVSNEDGAGWNKWDTTEGLFLPDSHLMHHNRQIGSRAIQRCHYHSGFGP